MDDLIAAYRAGKLRQQTAIATAASSAAAGASGGQLQQPGQPARPADAAARRLEEARRRPAAAAAAALAVTTAAQAAAAQTDSRLDAVRHALALDRSTRDAPAGRVAGLGQSNQEPAGQAQVQAAAAPRRGAGTSGPGFGAGASAGAGAGAGAGNPHHATVRVPQLARSGVHAIVNAYRASSSHKRPRPGLEDDTYSRALVTAYRVSQDSENRLGASARETGMVEVQLAHTRIDMDRVKGALAAAQTGADRPPHALVALLQRALDGGSLGEGDEEILKNLLERHIRPNAPLCEIMEKLSSVLANRAGKTFYTWFKRFFRLSGWSKIQKGRHPFADEAIPGLRHEVLDRICASDTSSSVLVLMGDATATKQKLGLYTNKKHGKTVLVGYPSNPDIRKRLAFDELDHAPTDHDGMQEVVRKSMDKAEGLAKTVAFYSLDDVTRTRSRLAIIDSYMEPNKGSTTEMQILSWRFYLSNLLYDRHGRLRAPEKQCHTCFAIACDMAADQLGAAVALSTPTTFDLERGTEYEYCHSPFIVYASPSYYLNPVHMTCDAQHLERLLMGALQSARRELRYGPHVASWSDYMMVLSLVRRKGQETADTARIKGGFGNSDAAQELISEATIRMCHARRGEAAGELNGLLLFLYSTQPLLETIRNPGSCNPLVAVERMWEAVYLQQLHKAWCQSKKGVTLGVNFVTGPAAHTSLLMATSMTHYIISMHRLKDISWVAKFLLKRLSTVAKESLFANYRYGQTGLSGGKLEFDYAEVLSMLGTIEQSQELRSDLSERFGTADLSRRREKRATFAFPRAKPGSLDGFAARVDRLSTVEFSELCAAAVARGVETAKARLKELAPMMYDDLLNAPRVDPEYSRLDRAFERPAIFTDQTFLASVLGNTISRPAGYTPPRPSNAGDIDPATLAAAEAVSAQWAETIKEGELDVQLAILASTQHLIHSPSFSAELVLESGDVVTGMLVGAHHMADGRVVRTVAVGGDDLPKVKGDYGSPLRSIPEAAAYPERWQQTYIDDDAAALGMVVLVRYVSVRLVVLDVRQEPGREDEAESISFLVSEIAPTPDADGAAITCSKADFGAGTVAVTASEHAIQREWMDGTATVSAKNTAPPAEPLERDDQVVVDPKAAVQAVSYRTLEGGASMMVCVARTAGGNAQYWLPVPAFRRETMEKPGSPIRYAFGNKGNTIGIEQSLLIALRQTPVMAKKLQRDNRFAQTLIAAEVAASTEAHLIQNQFSVFARGRSFCVVLVRRLVVALPNRKASTHMSSPLDKSGLQWSVQECRVVDAGGAGRRPVFECDPRQSKLMPISKRDQERWLSKADVQWLVENGDGGKKRFTLTISTQQIVEDRLALFLEERAQAADDAAESSDDLSMSNAEFDVDDGQSEGDGGFESDALGADSGSDDDDDDEPSGGGGGAIGRPGSTVRALASSFGSRFAQQSFRAGISIGESAETAVVTGVYMGPSPEDAFKGLFFWSGTEKAVLPYALVVFVPDEEEDRDGDGEDEQPPSGGDGADGDGGDVEML